jgi:hypothetical protein
VNLSGFNDDLSLAGGDVEWADVLNKPTFFSGSYDDLTDRPTWMTTSQAGVSLSGFNSDLTAAIVEWAGALNKPELFSGSYNDLTGKPERVRPSQGTVNMSEFNNDLGEKLPGTIAWVNVSNKPVFFSGSFSDLTYRPSIEDLKGNPGRDGRNGTDGRDDRDGASSWSDISNKPTWVATSHATVCLSGLNNDRSLTGGDVGWSNISGKPEWVRPSQGTVNMSEFNNDLGEELPGTIAWGNISNKHTFFSGSYDDPLRRNGDSSTVSACTQGGWLRTLCMWALPYSSTRPRQAFWCFIPSLTSLL